MPDQEQTFLFSQPEDNDHLSRRSPRGICACPLGQDRLKCPVMLRRRLCAVPVRLVPIKEAMLGEAFIVIGDI